ncbi:MAG: TonB-dependent receptor domain-containing protein, partial [Saprospiraceae bacterium]
CIAKTGTAQTARVQGRVVLKGNATPQPGVAVFLDGTGQGTITNGDGTFSLENIETGEYLLVASSIGYLTLQQSIALQAGETIQVQLEVEESVMGLPTAVVQSVSLTGGLRGLRNVPGSAQYISPRELEKFSYTDINRTLRTVPGVNLQEEDGFGLRPNIGLRGTGSERSSKITVMEDGVLAAPAPYAAPAAYYFPTIGRMQAVEILKGSSQIRFGPYTTGGAINLISTAIPGEFSGRIELLGGSFGNRNLHAFAGNSHKNFGYLVETFQYKSDGFKDLDDGGGTGFDKKDYLAKFRVNTDPDAKIYQSLAFKIGQAEEQSQASYLGLTGEDFAATPYRRYGASQKDRMDTRHEQYSVQHIVQFSPALDLTTTAYHTKFHRNWYKLDKVATGPGQTAGISRILENPGIYDEAYRILSGATGSPAGALQVKANNRNYRSLGVQTVLGYRFQTAKIKHTIDLGLRYHFDEIDRFQWVDGYKMDGGTMELTSPGTPGTESNRIESGMALATYLQYKLETGRWTLIPGLRYENILMERRDFGKNDPARTGIDLFERSNEVDVFIPGIGVNYKFDTHFDLFAGVHKGFSPPGTKEGTQPEKSINYELGSRYRNGALSGQAVLFFNNYDNLLGADLAAAGGTGSADLFNGGEVDAKGLEFQLTYDPLTTSGDGWSLPISLVYTYTSATFQNSFDSEFEGWGQVAIGDELPYLAHHQLALILDLSKEKFSFNLSGRYQSAMRTEAGSGPIPANEKTDAFFVTDASASYRLHQNIAFFASITNATDEVFVVARRPAGLRPSMPRAFMAGMKVGF